MTTNILKNSFFFATVAIISLASCEKSIDEKKELNLENLIEVESILDQSLLDLVKVDRSLINFKDEFKSYVKHEVWLEKNKIFLQYENCSGNNEEFVLKIFDSRNNLISKIGFSIDLIMDPPHVNLYDIVIEKKDDKIFIYKISHPLTNGGLISTLEFNYTVYKIWFNEKNGISLLRRFYILEFDCIKNSLEHNLENPKDEYIECLSKKYGPGIYDPNVKNEAISAFNFKLLKSYFK